MQHDKEDSNRKEANWLIIYTTNTEWDAQIVKGRLNAEGIPAWVLSQIDSTRGLTLGALAVAKVVVPVEFERQALDIIRQIQEQDNGNEFNESIQPFNPN